MTTKSMLRSVIGMGLLSGGLCANAATLIHSYPLNGSLADELVGNPLESLGGVLDASSYSFQANEGLNLRGLTTNANYSISIFFRFEDLGGYGKIVDFKDLGADAGAYNHDGKLNFYPKDESPVVFVAEQDAHVVITRDDFTSMVVGYVNGNQEISFTDDTDLAIFDATDNIVRFFQDDDSTSNRESSSGRVDCIKIWDGPLTATEISQLSSEPCGRPNLVELANFTATPTQNGIRLDWETTSERDTSGFFIWRGTPLADGKCTNDHSNYKDIMQLSFDNARGDLSSGATYSRTDSNVTSGTSYCYLLEDVEFDGDSEFHWNFIDSATAK
jgi:hypothetical protein